MKLVQIKNYRSFENVVFDLSTINFFVGENNVGKTSIMKILNSISNSNNLIFENEWLSKINPERCFNNNFKNIDIFIGLCDLDKQMDGKEEIFEKFKIFELHGYDKFVIGEIITTDIFGNIIKFEIEYKNFVKYKRVLIQSIKISKINPNLFYKGIDFQNLENRRNWFFINYRWETWKTIKSWFDWKLIWSRKKINNYWKKNFTW
ncbi:AAA family ATPase [Mesoplasma tabanidae]|uniref:Endonuclease GajA/Old nuclease/RecF-like AAA domain-containing protein n=1 Tax=Mesoplasma tabanidae TaxID=219745 RepID=A0A2K8P453_9MOLU|nr:AAA family ATPase [Mesoplasma tabanidae]ATZ21534.1 hypothetical protein MTABA_v1c03310 [Mesoplasma tabanidae]